jgi:hypothetical protein
MSNSAPARFNSKVPTRQVSVWQGTLTAAQITAGTIVVPAKTGMQFVCTYNYKRGHTGTCSGPTTIDFQESTSAGVITSHVSADLTDAVWRKSVAGDGTVVTTNLRIPLTVSEGVKVIAAGGSANTAMVTMDYIVEGYYVPVTGKHVSY